MHRNIHKFNGLQSSVFAPASGYCRLILLVLITAVHSRGQSLVDRGPWAGGVTARSATIKVKVNRDLASVCLIYGTDVGLADAVRTQPVLIHANVSSIATFQLEDLQPDTRYYYVLEVNGTKAMDRRGRFRTFPEGQASFKFAFASCAKTGSTNGVFEAIQRNDPLFFMNIGDFHYEDIRTNSRTRFREAYDRVLASPQQSALYRYTDFIYMWDDHDFGGNNSNRKASSHPAARLTYQEYVPHYPLPAGRGDVPIYQSFSVGRVKFILTDLRGERMSVSEPDTPEKTMLGTVQKEWFKKELLAAKETHPLIFWVSTVPWTGQAGTNFYPIPPGTYGSIHHKKLPPVPLQADGTLPGYARPSSDMDNWATFSHERRELADFFKLNGLVGRLIILSGDAHMLAADDGRNSDYATDGGAPIPDLAGAPLDQDSSVKGGPWSQGLYRPRKGVGCFGFVTVEDKGAEITVTYSGRTLLNEEKVGLKIKVGVGE